MKKYLAIALSVAMCLSIVSCGAPATSTPDASKPTTSTPDVSTPEVTPDPTDDLPYYLEGYETADADGNRITFDRSIVAENAVAVASKYEVSMVGSEIMENGGNAIDAAVAMGFALAVAEPFTSGPGGGGFATIRTEDGETIFVDFREIAPMASTTEMYIDAEGKSNGTIWSGGAASAVPGDVAGLLFLLDNYGSMTREEVMAPAIAIASEGLEISRYSADAIANSYESAVKYPEMQKVYWDENDLPLQEGDILVNPDLAKTLQMISDDGVDAFYTGPMAEAMVASVNKFGGVMTLEDVAAYEPTVLEPITGTYHGYQILSSPPPSSGGAHLIEILNILENFDVASMDVNSTEYIHLITETYKLVYSDRAEYMADTKFAPDVPLVGLTSKEYAAERASLIDLDVAQNFEFGNPADFEPEDTTHYSVADAKGNIVGITKTINGYFGSGVMVEGYGFMMNNEMADFSTNPESVNKVEGGKRPLSSMSPTVVLNEDGSPFMVLGTPGGARIFSSVAQIISRVIDHDMDLHDAICVPKIWNNSGNYNLQYELPLKGYEEYAVTDETIAELTAMGHEKIGTAASGAVQAIQYMEDGTLYGTADPRQDGKAFGF